MMRTPEELVKDIMSEINRRNKEAAKLFDPIDEQITKRLHNNVYEDVILNLVKENQSLKATQCNCVTDVDYSEPQINDFLIVDYIKKYHNLKEVIQNMVDRLEEGGEMTLKKDSIIVYCLREAIK